MFQVLTYDFGHSYNFFPSQARVIYTAMFVVLLAIFLFNFIRLTNFALAVAIELVLAAKRFVTGVTFKPFDVRVSFFVAFSVVGA